jgi:hypothetical protein
MLPTDVARPADKNKIALAMHARLSCEPRSSRQHTARVYSLMQALIHRPCRESRPDEYDST